MGTVRVSNNHQLGRCTMHTWFGLVTQFSSHTWSCMQPFPPPHHLKLDHVRDSKGFPSAGRYHMDCWSGSFSHWSQLLEREIPRTTFPQLQPSYSCHFEGFSRVPRLRNPLPSTEVRVIDTKITVRATDTA